MLKLNHLLWLAFVGLALFGCKEKDEPLKQDYNLQFSMEYKWLNEAIVFDSLNYASDLNDSVSVSTLKYFITDIVVECEDGNYSIPYRYIDGRDPAMNSFSVKVQEGKVMKKLHFVFGLDSNANQTGRFTELPEANMVWPTPMGGGYHYMKLEGKFMDNGFSKNYQAHSGPLNGVDRSVKFSFNLENKIMTKNMELGLIMNLGEYFNQPNVLDLNNVSGIMGNEQMQIKLHENAFSLFQLKGIQ